MEAIRIVLQLLGTAAAASAVWAVWASHGRPLNLLELTGEGIGDKRPPHWRPGLPQYITLALVALGFGIFLFGGTYSALSWLPGDWGSFDEDGSWTSYRTSISLACGVFGSPALLHHLIATAKLRLTP